MKKRIIWCAWFTMWIAPVTVAMVSDSIILMAAAMIYAWLNYRISIKIMPAWMRIRIRKIFARQQKEERYGQETVQATIKLSALPPFGRGTTRRSTQRSGGYAKTYWQRTGCKQPKYSADYMS